MSHPTAPTAPVGVDRCPRCGGGFDCGMAGTTPCACTTVTLDARLQAAMRERFSTCLCLPCLQSLAAGASLDRGAA